MDPQNTPPAQNISEEDLSENPYLTPKQSNPLQKATTFSQKSSTNEATKFKDPADLEILQKQKQEQEKLKQEQDKIKMEQDRIKQEQERIKQEKIKAQKEKEKQERMEKDKEKKEKERVEKEKEKMLEINRVTTDMPKEAEKQMKDYCQLCFKEFGIFTFRYHCRTCGRSCCNDCSVQVKVRQSTTLGMGGSYRICEFCDIKNENPQLEDYYRLECSLRQSDQEIVIEKIKWLKKTSKELEKQIAHEREDVSLQQASSQRQIDEIQQKMDGLNKDKQRLEKLREQLIKNNDELNVDLKEKDKQIKDLQKKRTEKLIELDKMKTSVEQAEKELRELVKEIGKYDDNFRSVIGSEMGDRSMSNDLLYVDMPFNNSIDNPKPIREVEDDDDDNDEVYFQFEGEKNNNAALSKTTIKKP